MGQFLHYLTDECVRNPCKLFRTMYGETIPQICKATNRKIIAYNLEGNFQPGMSGFVPILSVVEFYKNFLEVIKVQTFAGKKITPL